MHKIERFAYYERAKKAYCVVATGEKAQYANIILKKGVVKEGLEKDWLCRLEDFSRKRKGD